MLLDRYSRRALTQLYPRDRLKHLAITKVETCPQTPIVFGFIFFFYNLAWASKSILQVGRKTAGMLLKINELVFAKRNGERVIEDFEES